MQLMYRGVAYQAAPQRVTTILGSVIGKYRGVPMYERFYFTPATHPSAVSLHYRGAHYRAATNGFAQTDAPGID